MNIFTIGISLILPNYLITYITIFDQIQIYNCESFQHLFFVFIVETQRPIDVSIYGVPGDRRWVSANCCVIMKLRCCRNETKLTNNSTNNGRWWWRIYGCRRGEARQTGKRVALGCIMICWVVFYSFSFFVIDLENG